MITKPQKKIDWLKNRLKEITTSLYEYCIETKSTKDCFDAYILNWITELKEIEIQILKERRLHRD